MEDQISSNPSLNSILEEIEKNLQDNLNLHIPEDFPIEIISRIESIFKLIIGLENSYTLELLPNILLLLQDSEAYSVVMKLLKLLVISAPEDALAIIAQSAQLPQIKKQCLKCLKELLEVSDIRISHKVMHSLAGVLNDSDKETALLAREIGRKIRDAMFRTSPPLKKGNSNELVFGILPKAILDDFHQTENKKMKLLATKSIEEVICNLPDPSCLVSHQSDLFHILTEILNDSTRGFTSSGLKMLIHISKCPEINLSKFNPILRSFLGDTSINIRKSAFKILLRNLKYSKNLATELLIGINHENWHIREETINLFIGGMLNGLDFKDLDLISQFVKLLDDEKSKIRQATIEAFAVISKLGGREVLEAKIKSLIDEIAFKHISNRLEFPAIAYLKEDLIQIPRIVPSSAPTSFSTRSSFSPFPTPTTTQEFVSYQAGISPVPRSTSLDIKPKEISSSNIFKQHSDFIKPPLPTRADPRRRLPKIEKDEEGEKSARTAISTKNGTFFEKTYTV